MHVRELVELAAFIADCAPVIVQGNSCISASGIEQYWTSSKCRMDRWNRTLHKWSKQCGSSASASDCRVDAADMRALIEEILASEVLTRVWTALLTIHSRRHGIESMESIARSVYIGHNEFRHRVLELLVRGPGMTTDLVVKLNRFRHKSERWSDLLIGCLYTLDDLDEFAFDPGRARDFAQDLKPRKEKSGGTPIWPLVLASLREAFGRGMCRRSPNADYNSAIAESILSCMHSHKLEAVGGFHSLWLWRLTSAVNDAQVLVEELLA
jgi:hypothetical protein